MGGPKVEETAEGLKVSVETVRRDWKMARAWLHRKLSGKQPDECWQEYREGLPRGAGRNRQ
ncbi:MAG: DeoR family transcriptional regulator [Acidobacteria bacterium]|nr:MAG: DeoR family transcriptional regulator [Acidobacteriota bacterium]